jgi:hypothetical protein
LNDFDVIATATKRAKRQAANTIEREVRCDKSKKEIFMVTNFFPTSKRIAENILLREIFEGSSARASAGQQRLKTSSNKYQKQKQGKLETGRDCILSPLLSNIL